MPLLTATISGKFLTPDLSAGKNVTAEITAVSDGGRLAYVGEVIAGSCTVAISPTDGTASVTLPQLPQSGLTPANARWRLTFRSLGVKVTTEFNLTADTTWDALVDVSEVPITVSIQAAAEAAATAAAASAAAASASAKSVPILYAVKSVDSYGGDPTGVNDSTAAFNAALAALPIDPVTGYPVGRILLSGGTYKIGAGAETNNIGPKVVVSGQGRGATTVNYYGAGRAFRLMHSWFVADSYAVPDENALMGGGFVDFTIDGSHASAGAVGIKHGDGIGHVIDVEVRHFNGAGSVGILQANTVTWTEKVHNRSYIWDCDTHWRAEVAFADDTTTIQTGVTLPASIITLAAWKASFPRPWGGVGQVAPQVYVNGQVVTYTGYTVNGDGTATLTGCSGGTGALTAGMTVQFGSAGVSHGYNDIDLRLGASANQAGIDIRNGSNLYSGRLRVRGNFAYSTSAQPNAICLNVHGNAPTGTRLAGGNPAAQIMHAQLDVQVEAYGSGTNYPTTMAITAGSYIRGCYGILRWGGTNWVSLGLATASAARLVFQGFIMGDSSLNADTTTDGTGGPVMRGPLMLSRGDGNATGPVVHLEAGDVVDLVLTAASSGTIGFGTPHVGPQRKTVIIHQQSSGGTYTRTVTWPVNASPTTASPTVKWPGGVAPTMSTGLGATDVYTLVTLDGATWYGSAQQALA